MITSILLTEIVSTLRTNGLKPSGSESKGYTAFCPLHDDSQTRSLSVGIGEKDNILLHCFANCSTYQQIRDWLAAKGVDFPKKAQAPDSSNKVWKSITVEQWGEFRFKWDVDKADPVMEDLYVYRRKDGTPYAFKMRFTPKDFRRFRIEGDTIKPSWKGVKMYPYGWEIVCKAAAEGRPIAAVEGEKDANNVNRELGYACMSLGGVSDKWNDDWNEDLQGTPGIINIADNDLVKGNKKEPGLKKAQLFCEQIYKHFPVKLLMFNEHKDSTDWIKAGGTRADFKEKLAGIKPWEIPAYRAPFEVPDHVPQEMKPEAPKVEVKTNPLKKDWSKYPFAPCTDSANAIRLLANHGDEIRYVPKEKRWYAFNGVHWEPDDRDIVQEYCKEISKRIFAEELPNADFSIRTELDSWAKQCQDMSKIRAAKAAAQSQPELLAGIDDFDARPTFRLFNCKNGTLNFQTGALQDHDPKDMITHLSPHDYVPEIPAKWLLNVSRAFDGDQEMIEWFNIYIGYCFTGETYFQKYGYIEGPENTGKSFFPKTLALVMGTYYGTIDPQTLCEVDQRSAGADSDLHATRGKRLIVANEMKGNQKLDEQIIKALTGGDIIRTKLMGQNKQDLDGCAKLCFTGNERARVTPSGSIQRRLLTIPMRKQLQEKDFIDDYHRIVADEEGGQMIHLAMLGAQMATLKRLAMLPQLVQTGNSDYMREVNLAAQWKAERAKKLGGAEIMVNTAYKDFREFVLDQGSRPWTKPTFVKALQTEGMFTSLNHLNITVFKDFIL